MKHGKSIGVSIYKDATLHSGIQTLLNFHMFAADFNKTSIVNLDILCIFGLDCQNTVVSLKKSIGCDGRPRVSDNNTLVPKVFILL